MARPDHVLCIRDPRADRYGKSLCGRILGAFENTFGNLDHWFMNASAQGREIGCEECRAAILRVEADEPRGGGNA